MLYRSKCKLYRYDPDSGEWKERGIGQVRLLQHKENKKVRLLMRQEKTLKIRANHIGGWFKLGDGRGPGRWEGAWGGGRLGGGRHFGGWRGGWQGRTWHFASLSGALCVPGVHQ